MTWLFPNKPHTSYKEEQGQKVRHIHFDECAFGSNDGWSWETNWIVDHHSGYVAEGRREWVCVPFIRWTLAIRAVAKGAATESLSLVTMWQKHCTGKHSECWKDRHIHKTNITNNDFNHPIKLQFSQNCTRTYIPLKNTFLDYLDKPQLNFFTETVFN